MAERIKVTVNDSSGTERRFFVEPKMKLSDFQMLIHRESPSHIGPPADQMLFLGSTRLCYGLASGSSDKPLKDLGITNGTELEMSVRSSPSFRVFVDFSNSKPTQLNFPRFQENGSKAAPGSQPGARDRRGTGRVDGRAALRPLDHSRRSLPVHPVHPRHGKDLDHVFLQAKGQGWRCALRQGPLDSHLAPVGKAHPRRGQGVRDQVVRECLRQLGNAPVPKGSLFPLPFPSTTFNQHETPPPQSSARSGVRGLSRMTPASSARHARRRSRRSGAGSASASGRGRVQRPAETRDARGRIPAS